MTVIGAGVVGLAVATALSETVSDIVVIDKNDSFGRETSSRNSEVIHSGIYYAPGSLKATLCRQGARLLYRYCNDFQVPFNRLGKLILARDDKEVAQLEALAANGKKNSVELKVVDSAEISRLEPAVRARAGILLSATGIIDSHVLMSRLNQQAQAAGVIFAFNTTMTSVEGTSDGYVLGFSDDLYKLKARIVINCGGLNADAIAAMAGIDIDRSGYRLRYCKGSYFAYMKQSPVGRLIYPVPHENLVGLGIHATMDMNRQLRFGPDAEYVENINYSVDEQKRETFFRVASGIFPDLEFGALQPSMAGVRPKLSGPGEVARDFIIAEESSRGLPGLINLVGIESPGLTSCLAIGQMVKGMVDAISS